MACVQYALVFLLLMATSATSQSTKPWWSHCSDDKYTAGSKYEQNIESLSVVMPKRASSSPALFARGASYWKNEDVFALAECRRDANASSCQRCVAEAFGDAHLICPFSKEVLIYYDLCSIGFAERNFQVYPDFRNRVGMHADGSKVPTHCTKYSMAVSQLITDVADTAAHSSEKFAERMKALNEDGCTYTLYAFAQCSPTLTDKQCQMCLEDLTAAPGLSGYVGGRKSALFCSYRFEPYSFFDISPGAGEETVWIAVGTAVGGLVMILSVLTIIFCRRKRRLTQEKSSSENLGSESKAADEGETADKGRASEEDILSAEDAVKCPSALMCFSEITAMAQGKKILIFLDYDGIVSPIVQVSAMAIMPPEIREAVQKAAELFPTSIVSGRRIEKLKNFVKLNNLHYAASHGQEIVMSGELEPSCKPEEKYEQTVTAATHYLEEGSREIEGAAVENNKYAVSVHYRNVQEKDWPLVQKLVEDAKDAFEGLEITTGHMVLELRALTGLNKGTAVNYLINYILGKLGLDISEVLPIYFGDDVTDEDAFEVLREKKLGFGVLISQEPRTSKASYSLKDPFEVARFLNELVKWKKSLEAVSATAENDDEIVETSSRSSRLPR